jgi:hypothetical protein
LPILKADVTAPVLPQERLHVVPGLGEVIIRPLLLSDRLALAYNQTRVGRPREFSHITGLLAHAVVDANHEQVFTAEEWEAFGASNVQAVLDAWDIAWEMSGLDESEGKKKSNARDQASDDVSAKDGANA